MLTAMEGGRQGIAHRINVGNDPNVPRSRKLRGNVGGILNNVVKEPARRVQLRLQLKLAGQGAQAC